MSQITNINQFKLMGNIGKEPEVRQTDGGYSFINFSIAHSEKKYQGDGFETHWYDCIPRGQAKEEITRKIEAGHSLKGCPVEISGKLSTRTFTDRSGNKRTVVNLICFGIIFYEKRIKPQVEQRSQDADWQGFTPETPSFKPTGQSQTSLTPNFLDDSEIPF